MIDPDPFTAVERALWDILEAHSGFADLVKAGNRIKFAHQDVKEDPIRDSPQTADLPEVMILPTTADPNTHRTTAGPSLRQDFNIVITTGQTRTWAKLNPVKWAVWQALERVNGDLKTRCRYVRNVDTGTFQDGFNTGEQPDRGPRGWNSVLSVRVTMQFSHAEVAADE